jgi:hypothetical protein
MSRLSARQYLIIFFIIIFFCIILVTIIGKYGQVWQKKPVNELSVPEGGLEIKTPEIKSDFNIRQKKVNCPSIEIFCKNFTEISKNSKIIGIGAELPPGSPIFSAIDGEMSSVTGKTQTAKGEETLTFINITNAQLAVTAIYTVKGEWTIEGSVSAGDAIAETGAKLTEYNVPLIFALMKGDPISGEMVKFRPSDFIPSK